MISLTRTDSNSEGVFGILSGEGMPTFHTLEHAYIQADGSYAPKLPVGTYTCVRGQHMLHSGPVEAFEITNVPGHTGVLIHIGNTNADSEGCVLVGFARSGNTITQSRDAFTAFMSFNAGVDSFELTVS